MAKTDNTTDWCLAQVRPNAAAIALRHLLRQGFQVFNPQLEETRRQGAGFRRGLRMLFPGYLFVGITPGSAPWRVINSTQGVARLVQFSAEGPALVPGHVVTGLMARCDAGGVMMAPPAFAPGDSVRVTHGPFTDFVTEVETIDADQRVWVLLDLMGRRTRVAVAGPDIEKI